jgi:hypothetical protein
MPSLPWGYLICAQSCTVITHPIVAGWPIFKEHNWPSFQRAPTSSQVPPMPECLLCHGSAWAGASATWARRLAAPSPWRQRHALPLSGPPGRTRHDTDQGGFGDAGGGAARSRLISPNHCPARGHRVRAALRAVTLKCPAVRWERDRAMTTLPAARRQRARKPLFTRNFPPFPTRLAAATVF